MHSKKSNALTAMIACLPALFMGSQLYAQEVVRLDKRALSGLGLEGGPTDVEGQVRYGRTLYEGEKFNVFVAAGNRNGPSEVLEMHPMPFQEFCYLLNGTVTFKEDDGRVQTFHTGDFFIIPRGFSGQMITQGNQLYQVMVVMANERSDPLPGVTSPKLVDRTAMSGLDLESFVFEPQPQVEANMKSIHQGAELDVSIIEVGANSDEFTDMAEELVYVVSGSATLTSPGGEPQTFYKGDFFVVPEGWSGTWAVEGNHLYRELIVVAAD